MCPLLSWFFHGFASFVDCLSGVPDADCNLLMADATSCRRYTVGTRTLALCAGLS